jgi:hypothetical protein
VQSIHADLVEMRVTEGCNVGEPSCFLGVVDGNHGLAGTTHFRSDSFLGSIPTSPGSTPYSGPFEYRLGTGTLLMRETGVDRAGRGDGAPPHCRRHRRIRGRDRRLLRQRHARRHGDHHQHHRDTVPA